MGRAEAASASDPSGFAEPRLLRRFMVLNNTKCGTACGLQRADVAERGAGVGAAEGAVRDGAGVFFNDGGGDDMVMNGYGLERSNSSTRRVLPEFKSRIVKRGSSGNSSTAALAGSEHANTSGKT